MAKVGSTTICQRAGNSDHQQCDKNQSRFDCPIAGHFAISKAPDGEDFVSSLSCASLSGNLVFTFFATQQYFTCYFSQFVN